MLPLYIDWTAAPPNPRIQLAGADQARLLCDAVRPWRPADGRIRNGGLSDPAIPHSRQPYHAATGVAQTDEAALASLIDIVHRCARRSVAQLLDRHRAARYRLVGAGIVVGSDAPPERIANPHIRAHACEGRLFRTALEGGLQECGVTVTVVVERVLYPTAATLLQGSEASVKQAVTALGRGRLPGWCVDDKAATVAAWLVLAAQAGSVPMAGIG